MKALYIILLFLITSFSCFSQTDTTFITYDTNPNDDTTIYKTDTIINKGLFNRTIITGTTILPFSRNNISAMGQGYTLTKIDFAPCKNNGREVVRLKDSEVIGITKTDTTWTADLKIIENCCFDFLCEINIVNDTILNFIYTGYGDFCGCNCCYGLVYEITIEDFDDVAKVSHTMLNGDKRTITPIK